MNNRTMMRRLIWKDIVSIQPLLLVAAVCVVVFNLLLLMIWPEPRYVKDWSFALWILMPNFVALGAPAMLVGTEEDSGTMDWLRTLPVDWRQIAAAKLAVAVGAVLSTAILASLVLMLHSFRLHSWDSSTSPELLNLQSLLSLTYYTGLLLLLGFATLYVIRPPVMALMVLVPLYTTVAVASAVFAQSFQRVDAESAPGVLLFSGSGILFVSWLLQRLLARRRLLLPVQSMASRAAAALPASSDYRPSRLPIHSRPSEFVSLLWQQFRQTGPLCITMLVVSSLTSILFCATAHSGSFDFVILVGGMAPFFVLLSASWFGAIVFYGDNVHRRCGFFADRGISPTRIWWTRMLPPAIAFLLLLGSVGLIGLTIGDEEWFRFYNFISFVALGTVLFAFGQLVSQWSQRPILAFFAAPAYAVVCLVPAFYLMAHFNEGIEATVLVVPVLLFASWRLTTHWLEGEIQGAYTARVIGYTAIAVLIPCLWIASLHMRQISAQIIGQVFQLGVSP